MKQKWVKRIARAMLPCFVFFVFAFSFAPKAHAVSFEGNLYFGVKSWNLNKEYGSTAQFPVVNGAYTGNEGFANNFKYSPYFRTDPSILFEGPARLYLSYYFKQGNSDAAAAPTCNQTSFTVPSKYSVTYVNTNGQSGVVTGGLDAVSLFTPSDTLVVSNQGYAIEASWQGTEALPVRALAVAMTQANSASITNINGKGFIPTIKIPSARLIVTQTSGEMEALDSVVDELAAQSEILAAMKGDIVAILQDIYEVTGDIEIAANLMNSYLSTMVTHLNNIKNNTANINTKLGSIYTYMGTMLSSLETAISLNADTIEAAIAAQTAAMIAYLEQYFNTGNEVPDDTYQQQQDATNILDQMESLEKPNVDTIVPEIGDYTDSGVSGVLSAIFSSNLIVTMMTLSASFAFGAYVLFGKRE